MTTEPLDHAYIISDVDEDHAVRFDSGRIAEEQTLCQHKNARTTDYGSDMWWCPDCGADDGNDQ